MSDPVWSVCKPDGGEEPDIEAMNNRLLFMHPALTRDGQQIHREGGLTVKQSGDVSIAALFERLKP